MMRLSKLLRGLIAAALAAVALCSTFCSVATAQTFKRPAPTQADWDALAKLPDLTGVWEIPMDGPAARVTNPAIGVPPLGRPSAPALTPEYAAKKKALLVNSEEDNQSANCLPPGMPGIMSQPYPLEFLLTPGQVTIVIEAYSQVRHIYTDGRPLPEDPDPSFFGTSVGHWDGDTLIAETAGFSPATQLDLHTPHSDKMRIVERFKLADPNTMSIETTITDPEALTAPYVTNRILRRHRSWTISEYICEQNNRNYVDKNGKAGVNLTVPSAPALEQK